MGTYARIHIDIKLLKETPHKLIKLLDGVINLDLHEDNSTLFEINSEVSPFNKHQFFKQPRWIGFLRGGNANEPEDGVVDPTMVTTVAGYYHIKIDSEFKCQDAEIDLFIDLISPYLASRKKTKCVGWQRWDYSWEMTKIPLYANSRNIKELERERANEESAKLTKVILVNPLIPNFLFD